MTTSLDLTTATGATGATGTTADVLTHLSYDPVTAADVAATLARATHELAGRAADRAELAWKDAHYGLNACHPTLAVRAHLAARASLGQLRKLLGDAHPEVRYAATFNPFARDTGIQRTLAGDVEEEVVLSLLEQHDPCAEAIEIILAGPHTNARLQLVHRRIARWVLERLAADADPHVRRAAQLCLGGSTS